MSTSFLLIRIVSAVNGGSAWYVAGTIIALFIFGYLIYSLLKPEKF